METDNSTASVSISIYADCRIGMEIDMEEVVRLSATDYDELQDFLNTAFGYNADDGFLQLLPAMWGRDDEHMGKHLAIRADGRIRAVLGVYPLRLVVAGSELLFATCGNVATDAAYRNRGYMDTLMHCAMAEAENMGVDAIRLGGKRQRYERFGFEMIGRVLDYQLTADNVRHSLFLDEQANQIMFTPLESASESMLSFASNLQRAQPWHVDRGGYENMIAVMKAWKNVPYLAQAGDRTPIGVLSASIDGTGIAEQYAVSPEWKYRMLLAWQRQHVLQSIHFRSAAWDHAFNRIVGKESERVSASGATQVRILNWVKLANALYRLRAPSEMSGHIVIQVQNIGTLDFSTHQCQRTNDEPDIILSEFDAARLIFGPDEPDNVCAIPVSKIELVKTLFPLPMYWNGQDRV